jgi:hypothetical protein
MSRSFLCKVIQGAAAPLGVDLRAVRAGADAGTALAEVQGQTGEEPAQSYAPPNPPKIASMVRLYAALCVLGTLLPLWFLGSFVADEGLDPGAFADQLTASDVALFAWADVAVSGLAVIAFALRERARGLALWWPPVPATLLVGPSLGLPLLLLLRLRAIEPDEGFRE